MTNAPADLLAHRSTMAGITGLTNPSDIGIVGDGAHQKTGGYHEGKDVLSANGMYHPPASANVGSTGEDYSCRIARDRNGLTNSASAVDYGDNWPHGGREAWIRFNNMLVAALHANVPALNAIRAVNYTPDGTAKKRTDRQAGWTVVSSSDSVDIHTHVEYYRDTEGKRQTTLDYVAQLARAAIANQPTPAPTPPSPQGDDEDMFLACTGTDPTKGQLYVCNGQTSAPISLADAKTLLYLATTTINQDPAVVTLRFGKNPPPDPNRREWFDLVDGAAVYHCAVRGGWSTAFGMVIGQFTLSDAQITAIVDQLAEKLPQGATADEIKAILNGTTLKTA